MLDNKMKAEELHQNFLNVIKSAIPQGDNLATTLADILCLGKEAIYRRLRGDVPFSFSEVSAISRSLNISLDNVIGTSVPSAAIFHIDKNDYLYPDDQHYASFLDCTKGFSIIASDPVSKIGYSGNSFPHTVIMRYEEILKFSTFKWMYQQKPLDLVEPYDKIEIEDKLMNLHSKYGNLLMKIKNSVYILDNMVFSYLINDIKYFYSARLISKEVVQKLKKELITLLEELEDILTKGKFNTGNKVQIYISSLNIPTSFTYVESTTFYFTTVQVFILNGLISYDREIFNEIKNMMKAQQRFSTLISETGEVQRVQFLKKQRSIINSL